MNKEFKQHLLACIAEEASEVTKEACKMIRFGANFVDVISGESHLKQMITEANELLAVIEMLTEEDFSTTDMYDARVAKKCKVTKYYVQNCGE